VSVSRFVRTNGIRLHYLEHGATGPTLVLIPGLTANAQSFEGLIEAGLAARLHVLAFDLRGRGLSEKPDGGYTMADHAADVLGALDELELETVALGGHSFGALLTLLIAAERPERVTRAILLDAPAEVDARIVEQIRPSLDRLESTYPSLGDYLAHVRSMPYFDGQRWDQALETFYSSDVEPLPDGSVRAHCRPEHIAQAIAATLEVDWPAIAKRVAQPTLLVRATQPFGPPGSPPILSAEQAAQTVALLSRGRLLEIPGNHVTCLFGEHAPVVAEAIAAHVLSDV
jgi:pimeloyl-ACP methyl ester carboxylesterase